MDKKLTATSGALPVTVLIENNVLDLEDEEDKDE